MAKRVQRNNGKRYSDTEKMVACQIVRSNGGKLTDELLSQIQLALNIPTLSWDTVTRWWNASKAPKPETVEQPVISAASGESRVYHVHLVDEVETDFAKSTTREIIEQTFRRYAKQANRLDSINKTDGKDAAAVMASMVKLLQLVDGLPTEIVGAASELTELVAFLREEGIELSPAIKAWREQLKARKEARLASTKPEQRAVNDE